MILTILAVLELNAFLKKIKKLMGNKNIKRNIFRIEANNSIIYGYFWIGIIYLMLEGKTLIDYINLLFSYDFEKNIYIIILSYFKNEWIN